MSASLRRQLAVTSLAAVLIAGVTACGSSATGTTTTAATSAAASPTSTAGSSATDASSATGGSSAAGSSDGSASASPAQGSTGSATDQPGNSGAQSSVPSSGASASGQAAGGALGGECTPEALATTTKGTLTIATSEPTYEPWMVDNDPTNGKGFESAVAYAVAAKLGFAKDKVSWKRVGFDEAIAKQSGWDFDINQFSITDERKKVVDFSSGYYDIAQAVVTVKGSPAEKATSVADLKNVKIGAMTGTTSMEAVNDVIKPAERPASFKDNSLATEALKNGQIQALVVDLPTAFYISAAELDGKGVLVGQLPGTSDQAEQFGLLLAKGSPITACATKAVDALRADGTLDQLNKTWLSGKDSAPVLAP